ncbi:hypothetical protein ACDI99_10270 [Acinetobacter radioresistens]|uniref:hypothetical protein n=2 Tax=Acinetobacter radioresistens TaxID=40216 RepID=UPI00202FC6DD|nr:hypothetical protein [Acinetobacter radioresistens]MCM1934583.1 hypothetical protein [Acinetobacter radioresistens]MCM1952130.1 hypothetical protein [Acinetobacter radioresistens]MCU4595317.1 hypothetical protein [Acinetobacter radioresistens]
MRSKKLWCVAIRPESDSPYEQWPAASKEIAERAVARYRKMNHAIFHSEVIANSYDEYFQVQQWHGTRREHIRKMFYTEEWLSQAMYQCFDLPTACKVFEYGEIVTCYKKGSSPLTTSNFEEAKRFYEVA